MNERQPPPKKSGLYWVWTRRNPKEPVLWRYVAIDDIVKDDVVIRPEILDGKSNVVSRGGVWQKYTHDGLKSVGGIEPDAWVGPVTPPKRPKGGK